jgi:aryl-alcohol dehydrogenase-like predicted oxidoreductase
LFVAKFGLADGEPGLLPKANPEYVRAAFNRSPSMLRIDYAGLYYPRRADPMVPIEHTVVEMTKLVKPLLDQIRAFILSGLGEVKHLGLSKVRLFPS